MNKQFDKEWNNRRYHKHISIIILNINTFLCGFSSFKGMNTIFPTPRRLTLTLRSITPVFLSAFRDKQRGGKDWNVPPATLADSRQQWISSLKRRAAAGNVRRCTSPGKAVCLWLRPQHSHNKTSQGKVLQSTGIKSWTLYFLSFLLLHTSHKGARGGREEGEGSQQEGHGGLVEEVNSLRRQKYVRPKLWKWKREKYW